VLEEPGRRLLNVVRVLLVTLRVTGGLITGALGDVLLTELNLAIGAQGSMGVTMEA